MNLTYARTPEQVRRCFPVMVQLRPHLGEDEFVARVERQQASGYRLAFIEDGGEVVSVAGFRLVDYLAWGHAMYVDDLVTDSTRRSAGHGQRLFDALLAVARDEGCEQFHLDSGVQRFDAHRFYLRNRMDIASHHFSLTLQATPAP